MYHELVGYIQRDPTAARQAVDLIFVAHDLERIADHATNIAEVALYLVEGIDVRHHAEVRE
jgi:phosphate transport system protein